MCVGEEPLHSHAPRSRTPWNSRMRREKNSTIPFWVWEVTTHGFLMPCPLTRLAWGIAFPPTYGMIFPQLPIFVLSNPQPWMARVVSLWKCSTTIAIRGYIAWRRRLTANSCNFASSRMGKCEAYSTRRISGIPLWLLRLFPPMSSVYGMALRFPIRIWKMANQWTGHHSCKSWISSRILPHLSYVVNCRRESISTCGATISFSSNCF